SPLPIAADAVISVVWILGITNAFNLLDNIDGLAAGTAAAAATTFFLIALFNDQDYSALLAIGLAGAMLGFLRSNFHPATIYMGDAGEHRCREREHHRHTTEIRHRSTMRFVTTRLIGDLLALGIFTYCGYQEQRQCRSTNKGERVQPQRRHAIQTTHAHN
ncbi:MAG: hypothetical protein EB138_05865, partial [Actinobacteria bacterium]|nr:hypothetical protein [Actinomycetota bacterium]